MNIHSKYNNMHRNGMFNALICIINHVNTIINCMYVMNDPSELYFMLKTYLHPTSLIPLLNGTFSMFFLLWLPSLHPQHVSSKNIRVIILLYLQGLYDLEHLESINKRARPFHNRDSFFI